MPDFTMRNISLSGEDGILFFEAPTRDEADDFFNTITEAMFPSGGRASTRLAVKSGEQGYFLYQVDSGDHYVELYLRGVTKTSADFIANSVANLGGLAMVFGYSDGSVPVFINPLANHLVRTVVEVDGVTLIADGPPRFEPILQWLVDTQSTVKSRHEG